MRGGRARLARGGIAVVAAVAAGTALVTCLSPTQVTLTIVTRGVDCGSLRGIQVFVGPDANEVEQRAQRGEVSVRVSPSTCERADRVGTLVVSPSSDHGAILVVAGVEAAADTCVGPDYVGCIVARRRFAFRPHATLPLEMTLDIGCEGVACDASSTCVARACVASDDACTSLACAADPTDAAVPAATPDAGVPEDADPSDSPAPTCRWEAPFGAPTPVLGTDLLPAGPQLAASLTADELTIYVVVALDSADTDGGASRNRFYRGTRASRDDPFAHWGKVNVGFEDGELVNHVSVTAAGDTLYFARVARPPPDASTDFDIFKITGPGGDSPQPVPVVAKEGRTDFCPFATLDGLALWYATDEGIVKGSISDPGPLSEELVLPGASLTFPVLSADRLTLFYGRVLDVNGVSRGTLNRVHRFDESAMFQSFALDELAPFTNGSYRVYPSWLSPDGCRLYLSLAPTDGGTASQILVATRSPQ